MIPRLLLCCIALAGQVWAQNDPEPSEGDWKIHLEFHFIALPEKIAVGLLPALSDDEKIGDAWKKVEGLLQAGTAKIVVLQHRTTTHRDELTVNEGQELRYPTGFDLPVVIKKPAEEKKETGKKKSENAASIDSSPTGVAYPIEGFATQMIGTHLVADAQVSPTGERILVQMTLSRTWLLSWDEFEVGRMSNNEKIVIKQPRVNQSANTSTVALTSGERTFLGWHPVPGKEGEVELSFLRAWTTRRKSPGQ